MTLLGEEIRRSAAESSELARSQVEVAIDGATRRLVGFGIPLVAATFLFFAQRFAGALASPVSAGALAAGLTLAMALFMSILGALREHRGPTRPTLAARFGAAFLDYAPFTSVGVFLSIAYAIAALAAGR